MTNLKQVRKAATILEVTRLAVEGSSYRQIENMTGIGRKKVQGLVGAGINLMEVPLRQARAEPGMALKRLAAAITSLPDEGMRLRKG